MSIFTVFLKNRKFISKIRISKVTDYAALKVRFLMMNFPLVPGKIANGHASNESLKDKLLEVQRDKKELGMYEEVEKLIGFVIYLSSLICAGH